MANGPHEWDLGWEYFYDGTASRRRLCSFGFALSPWQTVRYTEYPSIGRFEGDVFDPTTWKPQTPTTAYMELRADDAFWAARRVMAFSDELIRAAVHTGQFSDRGRGASSRATCSSSAATPSGVPTCTAINPVVNPRLDATGSLTFENAAVASGVADAPAEYHAAWSRFDNATGASQPIGDSRSATTTIQAPRGSADNGGQLRRGRHLRRRAQSPVVAAAGPRVFPSGGDGWTLVGLERLPDQP